MDSLSEVFGSYQWKSEPMKEAHRIYSQMVAKLTKDRELIASQMEEFMWHCKEAYNSWYCQAFTDEERISTAGKSAIRALTHLECVRKLLRQVDIVKYQNDAEVMSAINRTSDWFKSMGWHICLPEPIDANGNKSIKTAHGCLTDMLQFVTLMNKYVAAKEESNNNKRK